MFNPPRDGDPVILGPAESGPDPDTVEQAFDQTEEPVRHPDPANGFKNKGVIDRVEGFGRVHEENEKIPISKKRIQGVVHPFYHRVEELVKLPEVFLEDPARDKTFLSFVQMSKKSEAYRFDYNFRDNAVIRIGNGNRTGVVNGEETLLGDKEEKTEIKAFRGFNPVGQSPENTPEDQRRDLSDGPPGREGDPVRTWGRVVRAPNRVLRFLNRREGGEEVTGDRVRIIPKVLVWANGLVSNGSGSPDLRPKIGSHGGHFVRVRSKGGREGKSKGLDPLPSGREGKLDLFNKVRFPNRRGPGVAGLGLDAPGLEKVINPGPKPSSVQGGEIGVTGEKILGGRGGLLLFEPDGLYTGHKIGKVSGVGFPVTVPTS